MIHVVRSDNRDLYHRQLEAMYADRKRVFVDRLGWELPVIGGRLEVDGFDDDEAVYLVALDASRTRHLGSVRLLPTTRPHLLGQAFADLCAGHVPTGPGIWEITRFCTSPSLPDKQAGWQVQRELATAMVEYALLCDITSYTFVTHLAWLPFVLSLGWDADPLGLPKGSGRDAIGAAKLNITPATLSLFRTQWNLTQSVLQLEMAPARAA